MNTGQPSPPFSFHQVLVSLTSSVPSPTKFAICWTVCDNILENIILPTTVSGTKDTDLAAQFVLRRTIVLFFVYFAPIMPSMLTLVAAVSSVTIYSTIAHAAADTSVIPPPLHIRRHTWVNPHRALSYP